MVDAAADGGDDDVVAAAVGSNWPPPHAGDAAPDGLLRPNQPRSSTALLLGLGQNGAFAVVVLAGTASRPLLETHLEGPPWMVGTQAGLRERVAGMVATTGLLLPLASSFKQLIQIVSGSL